MNTKPGGGKTSISRQSYSASYNAGANEAASEPIEFAASTLGILNPAGSAAATFTFYCAASQAGPFVPVNADGSPVSLALAAGQAAQAPDAIFTFPYIKIVADVAASIQYTLKG